MRLYAHEVAWGSFTDLERWCESNSVPFVRWSGAFPGSMSAERVVFVGNGEPRIYTTDEDDCVLIDRGTVDLLGSIAAIRSFFDAADFAVPPLIIEGETVDASAGPRRPAEGMGNPVWFSTIEATRFWLEINGWEPVLNNPGLYQKGDQFGRLYGNTFRPGWR